jgi:hypothetical protein
LFTALQLAAAFSIIPLTAAADVTTQGDEVVPCAIAGTIRSGEYPLPGVSLRATSTTEALSAPVLSSTRADGSYRLPLRPDVPYRVIASLPGFVEISRDVVVPGDDCTARADIVMTLADPGTPVAGLQSREAADTTSRAVVLTDLTQIATNLGVPVAFFAVATQGVAEFPGVMVRPDRDWWADRRRAGVGAGPRVPPTAAEAAAEKAAGARAAAASTRPASRPTTVPKAPVPQRAYQGTVNIAFNGSALDSPPFQLRPDRPVERRPYQRQTYGMSLSGPLRLPRVYEGGRRTTMALTYSGNRGTGLFDQYATVPTEAIRAGDFSAVSTPVIDPATGAPFSNRRIPDARIHPAARALLRFIPAPNLPGTTRNFHYTTTSDSLSNATTVRVTHQFQPAQPANRPPAERTAASLVVQVQIRHNRSEQVNVFPDLGGTSRTTTVAIPVTINVQRGRYLHAVRLDVSTSLSRAESRYAHVEDVAGEAGIVGPAREPFAWGVPSLSFSTYSSVRDVNPTRRHDQRLVTGYTWTHTAGRHTVASGAEGRFDWSDNQTDPNARGTFVFTGRHTAGTGRVPRGAGFDFADFLLGLPQAASVQYGPGRVHIRGRALSLYVQDDWRRSSALTLTLGLRYEMVWPFVEANRQMVNLDVAPDFTEVAPVLSGGAGPFTGLFPAALMHADPNNLAPRLAVAWKGPRALTLRGGYGVSFNSGPYSGIARQLVGQPPFAASQRSEGTVADPLDLADPFRNAELLEAANTFGVERDYAIGTVQTWNAELSRPFRTVWTASGSYTGKRGLSLDLIRTPNRDPAAADFRWQTSDGRSLMHGLTLRLQRRKTHGLGGTVTYAIARAQDDMAIAQNDADLDSEWGLSTFDRRHQLSGNVSVDLPFGSGRPWLTRGAWASVLGGWSATATLTVQSGTPLTPRVTGAQAANRPLRPDATGERVQLPSPTIDMFFNTAAFTLPEPGQFGTAGRNTIIGPASRLLNASIVRDLRLGAARVLTARLDADNLLNLVNYSAINTTVNSSAFGQVTSVRPMRTMTLSLQVRF